MEQFANFESLAVPGHGFPIIILHSSVEWEQNWNAFTHYNDKFQDEGNLCLLH